MAQDQPDTGGASAGGKPALHPGLLQLTCALRVPPSTSERAGTAEEYPAGGGLSREAISDIKDTLTSIFHASDYLVQSLAKLIERPPGSPSAAPTPGHTWLDGLSRHVAMRLDEYFYDPSKPIPAQVDFRMDQGVAPQWTPYLRAQVAVNEQGEPYRDGTTGKYEDLKFVDPANYVIAPPPAATDHYSAMWTLQRFLAQLFAERKQLIFASHLGERIYHVWLPPGTLSPVCAGSCQDEPPSLGSLTICPFITLVRRPHEAQFRRTIAVSFVCLAVGNPAGTSRRDFSASEIPTILEAILQSSSTYIPSPTASIPYQLSGPLYEYLKALTSAQPGKRPLTLKILTDQFRRRQEFHKEQPAADRDRGSIPATLRQWFELIATAGFERGVTGNRPWQSDRQLADEVLASFRMSSTWSVVTLESDFAPLSEWQPYADGSWRPSRIPASIVGLLEDLMTRPRGFGSRLPRWAGELPIEIFPRVDPPEPYSGNYLIWQVPGRRGIVAVVRQAAEGFPSSSALLVFGALGHMVIGASCSIDMIEYLARDVVRQPDSLRRADRMHELLVELEEMFDLDMAWEVYCATWRQFLKCLKLDRHYQMMIDRANLLYRYASAKEAERSHGFEVQVTTVGTGLVFAVLLLTGAGLFDRGASLTVNIPVSLSAVGIVGYFFIRFRLRTGENAKPRRRVPRRVYRSSDLARQKQASNPTLYSTQEHDGGGRMS